MSDENKNRPRETGHKQGKIEMNTKAIPTDKFGKVYYGPKTTAQAEAEIRSIVESESEMPIEVQSSASQIAADLASRMETAGYTRAASNLRLQYGV